MLAVADGLLAALARTGEEPIDVVASTGSSTGGLADPESVHRSAVCVCFPPPNQGTWTNRAVDAADPRWVFSPPPRNKANFAWIQQTVACMEEDGCATQRCIRRAAGKRPRGAHGPEVASSKP